MTWRERVVAARERGGFSTNDMKAWDSGNTCPVGEAMSVFWIQEYTVSWLVRWNELANSDRGNASLRALNMLSDNDFDGLDGLLDELEDRALLLKRETD